MEMIEKLEGIDSVIICGIGYQAETIAKYMCGLQNKKCILLVDHFTQNPRDSYKIPSKRSQERNSFSEVDLLMDVNVDGVDVKRFDMLSNFEKENCIFLYYSDRESLEVFDSISPHIGENFHYMDYDELHRINQLVWRNDCIIEELWRTNRFLYSEVQILKNVLRRQLKATAFDFHFEFHIVEHCNLKCAGCTHFAPLAQEKFLSPSEFQCDVNRMAELLGGNAKFINLLGGEPLLHPEICEFLEMSRTAFPHTVIRVVTNGILLNKMQEKFWEYCKKYSITIGITQYPIEVDYESLVQLLKSKGIKYESFSGTSYPRDEMWRLSLDETASNHPIDNFIACPRANACIFVSHGKVFNCATMANIEHFNKYFNSNFNFCKEDYVDIYEINHVNEMFDKLCNPKPFCRFCNIEKRKYGVRWERSSGKIGEWI